MRWGEEPSESWIEEEAYLTMTMDDDMELMSVVVLLNMMLVMIQMKHPSSRMQIIQEASTTMKDSPWPNENINSCRHTQNCPKHHKWALLRIHQ